MRPMRMPPGWPLYLRAVPGPGRRLLDDSTSYQLEQPAAGRASHRHRVARARQLPRDLEAGAVVRAYHEVHSCRIRGAAAIRPLAERRPWITGPSSHDGTSRFAQMRMSAADLRPSDSISTCERYLNRYRGIPRTDRDRDARRNSTSPRTRRTARPSPGRPPQHRRGCLVPAVAGMGLCGSDQTWIPGERHDQS
jgi:hypothetical protein